MTKSDLKPYLTPNEAAELLMVSPVTLRQWAQKGLLQAEMTAGGHRRYRREELARFAQARGLRAVDRGAARVLVVDDDVQFAGFLHELLAGGTHPAIVEIAHDGFEAGRKIHSFRPDCVLLDLNMPGMDGIQVCQSLKQDPSTRAIRVIAITGFATPENMERLLATGADACLSKPLDIAALFRGLGWDEK